MTDMTDETSPPFLPPMSEEPQAEEQPADPAHATWQCVNPSTSSPSGHPIWEQEVAIGGNPVCPICGSTSAMQVTDPGNPDFSPFTAVPVGSLVLEERLGTDQFGNPQQPQPVSLDASQLPQNRPGFDAVAAQEARTKAEEDLVKAEQEVNTAAADQRAAIEEVQAEQAAAAQKAGTAPAPGTPGTQPEQPVFTSPVPPAAPTPVEPTAPVVTAEPPVTTRITFNENVSAGTTTTATPPFSTGTTTVATPPPVDPTAHE